MSDKNSSLQNCSMENMSLTQLKDLVNRLRSTVLGKGIVEILRFLHIFSVSQKESVEQLIDIGIIPILKNYLQHEDENVQIEAFSLFSVLALKKSKSGQSALSDTSVIILSDLLEAVDEKSSAQVLETLGQQFQFISSTRPFVASVDFIMKLVTLLKSKEIKDAGRINILTIASNIIKADIATLDLVAEEEDAEEDEDEDEDQKPSVSSGAGSSASASAGPPSYSSRHSTSAAYKFALANLSVAISSIKSRNATVLVMRDGCLRDIKKRYGANLEDETVQEGEKYKVQFDADSTYVKISGGTCEFNTSGNNRTVFLSQSFKDKIYKIETKVIALGDNYGVFIGFCPETKKPKAVSSYITVNSGVGTGGSGCLYLAANNVSVYCTGNSTIGSNVYSNFPVQPDTVISLELNMTSHTLHFFVNDKRLPVFFQNIPSMPLSFGITGYYTPKLQVTSVKRLSTTSAKSGGSPFNWS